MNRINDFENDEDNGYIDNNKVYLKLKIGWKTSSIFSRFNKFSNYQSCFLTFSYISMIISEIQYFFYIYNISLMSNMPDSLSYFFHIIVLKYNNSIYDITFMVILLLCNMFLFVCIFFDFLKSKDSLKEFPKQLEMVGAFISQCIYGIFAFPVLFSLFNFLECNKSEDETEFFLTCFSPIHILFSLFSVVSFLIILIYSYVQYIFIVNFIPTKNHNMSVNKYTGKEDYYEFIGKFILVLNEYVIAEFFDNKIIEIGITSIVMLFLTWRQLSKQPFHSNICNNFKNIIKTGLSFASIILFIMEVLHINNKTFVFYLIIGAQVIFSVVGFYVGKFIRNKRANGVYRNLRRKYSNIDSRHEAYTLENDDDDSNYSLDRIINETYRVKKDYVFDNINDCIFACDFMKHNHELNSFLLAAKILDECTIQYKKNPMSYIYYWLYLNTMITSMRSNTELYEYEKCIKQIELFERIQNNILRKVIRLGNTYYTKYLIYYILIVRSNNTEDEESEEGDEENKNKNLNFHENELKKHSINLHFLTLNELSNAFKDLKGINTRDDVFKSVNNILSLTKRINETEASYKAYIKACYMSSDSLLLYNLFLENIMIDYYAASFYMKVIEENKEKKKKKSINRLSLMRQSRSKLTESVENLEVTKRKESLVAVKKEKKKQNESKERVLERLQKPVNKFAFLLRILSIVEYLFMSIGCLYYRTTYGTLKNQLNYIIGSAEGPRLMNSITKDVRLLSISSLAEDDVLFNNTFSLLEKSKLYIDTQYIPLIYGVNTINIEEFNIYNPLTEDLYDDISHQSYFQVTSDIQQDLNVILDKDYLYNQADLLKNPYFKYFSENSKGSHEKVYLNSLEYIQKTITNIIDYQLLYVLVIMSVSIFIIALMILKGFIPMLNRISKFKFCVVQLFRDIPLDNVNRIIHFHEKQSKYYLENYSNIIKNNPDDDENMKVKKNVFRDNSKIDLYTFIIVTLITVIFMILPLISIFIFREHSLGELELIFVSTKRTYYSQAIQTWAYELFYMDSDIYRRGEPSAFISEAIDILENLEKSINKGTYGGKSIDKYQILKSITKNNGCIRGTGDESECDERVYDENYTEQIANSPLDVIVSEYIIQTRDFISSFSENYSALQHTKEDAQERLEKLFSDPYIIFHNKIIKEINGHVKKMNEVLVDDIHNYINTTINLIDFLHVISMIFIPFIYFFYFKNFAKGKLREMETLTIVFSNIPRSVCEKSTKIKLFIRHGTLESAF